jgi:hypothetical protein
MATVGAGTNWYEVLGLDHDATDEELAVATERLARQAAAIANTAPERSQQLRDTVRSIRTDLLAGPAARAHYDARLAVEPSPGPSSFVAAPPPPNPSAVSPDPPPPPGDGGGLPPAGSAPAPLAIGSGGIIDSIVNGIAPTASRFRRFLQAGWTCLACGADGGPGDEFCSKCGASMKANAPSPSSSRRLCAACSFSLAATDRFCARCGTVAG